MLTLNQVKTLLHNPNISDEQAAEIQDQMRLLVEIIFEQWKRDMARGKLKSNPEE